MAESAQACPRLDIDRMRERYDARMIDRHLDALDRWEAENFALGPQAPDCDERDACTCSLGCGACERPDAALDVEADRG